MIIGLCTLRSEGEGQSKMTGLCALRSEGEQQTQYDDRPMHVTF